MVLRKSHLTLSVAALFACLPGPAAVQPVRIQAALAVHDVSVAVAGNHGTSARPVHTAFAVPQPGNGFGCSGFR